MGHTQLKTGVQGGHVEHRGETEVKVVQKEESGEGRQKNTKSQNPFLGTANPRIGRRRKCVANKTFFFYEVFSGLAFLAASGA